MTCEEAARREVSLNYSNLALLLRFYSVFHTWFYLIIIDEVIKIRFHLNLYCSSASFKNNPFIFHLKIIWQRLKTTDHSDSDTKKRKSKRFFFFN